VEIPVPASWKAGPLPAQKTRGPMRKPKETTGAEETLPLAWQFFLRLVARTCPEPNRGPVMYTRFAIFLSSFVKFSVE
jgi:hypothetical protein